MTTSECLLQISELTKKNLQILEVLNNSFYTKSSHISTTVGDTTFTIPSYIALENKVNHLQDAFNNLVHAAKSGQAWFNFDGNSREIFVNGYQHAPNPIGLTKTDNKFSIEASHMFKDMLSPQPYLNFDMSALPDDVTKVVVKKLIPYREDLILSLLANIEDTTSGAATAEFSYADVVRIMNSLEQDLIPEVDYLEYETTYDLPIRKNTKSGTYVIEEILSDKITENLENAIKVKIRQDTPLRCTNFDGIGYTDLQAGDVLITYDGSAKLKVTNISSAARTLELLVMSGEYVNPIAAGKEIDLKSVSDYSKLRLYSVVDDNRELHIPLEEDKYVFIAVAPLNNRLNIQTEWGQGLLVQADMLVSEDDSSLGFREYYNKNVQNIGDTLVELSNIIYPSITKYTPAEMSGMLVAPVAEIINTDVVQINRHLNDSEAVKNIRALYSQKKVAQSELQECQDKIAALQAELAQISFDDMSGTRSAYTAQIADLKNQQNNLVTGINKIIDDIANAANNAEIPIESGKFRVRGYVDVDTFLKTVAEQTNLDIDGMRQNILGIECRYRYKNPDIPQANVAVIKDFLFTEWADYCPPLRERAMTYKNGRYELTVQDIDEVGFNKTKNVPKFNQIDIPITQGEIVEFQVRILWGFGHPFTKTSTAWSELIEVTFPPELVKDVQVTTIIEENNSDIESNRFQTILQTNGISAHVDDKLEDQDITYFHKPNSISSGFYTPERRVVPLGDKLKTMSDDITYMMDMLEGTTGEALKVQFVCDGIATVLQPDIENIIHLPAVSAVQELDQAIPSGQSYKENGCVKSICTILITNITSHSINIFSQFPCARDKFVGDSGFKFRGDGTIFRDVLIAYPNRETTETNGKSSKQRGNQFIAFADRSPYDPTTPITIKRANYKDDEDDLDSATTGKVGIKFWPMSQTEYGLCLEGDIVNSKLVLPAAGSVAAPMIVRYAVNASNKSGESNSFGFCIQNSLFKDPIYYQVKLVAKYNQTISDALSTAKQSIDSLTTYNVTVR